MYNFKRKFIYQRNCFVLYTYNRRNQNLLKVIKYENKLPKAMLLIFYVENRIYAYDLMLK